MKDQIRIVDISNISRYSYSKLSTYETCPLLYYRTYIENNRGEDNGFSLAGSIAHEIIDEYYKGKYCDFELLDVFEERWQTEFLDKGHQVQLILPKFTKNLTENYYNSFVKYFSDFAAYDGCKIIETEKQFVFLITYKGKTIIYTGIIDALGIDEDGQYVIWDSKSKGAWKDQEELDNYLVQLYTYSIYVNHVFGQYPKYLKFNQFRLAGSKRVTTEEFDIKKYESAIDWIFSTIEKIENEKLFLPNVDEFFCKNLCGIKCEDD